MSNRSWFPLVAGILDIVSGVAAFFGFLCVGFAAAMVSTAPGNTEEVPLTIVMIFLVSVAAFILVIGMVAILGGALTLRGGRWGWALTGAIAATVICPPLGIPAIVLTILGESEIRGTATAA